MKIIRLRAENIKKLIAVEIEPSGAVVRITGKNGAGKTSILDAIYWALGGQQNITEQPIRRGQKKASVELDLGDIIVKRTFTEGATALVIENKAGLRFKTPQTMLDGLIGRLAFDPLEFLRQPPRKQFETLRQLTGVDLSALDGARQKTYDERTIVNRDVARLKAQVAGVSLPPTPQPVDATEVDTARVVARLTAATKAAGEKDRLQGQYEESLKAGARLEQDLVIADDRLQEELREINEHIAMLKKKAQEKTGAFDRWTATQRNAIAAAKKQLQTIAKQAATVIVPDLAEIQAELEQSDNLNKEVRVAVSNYENGKAAAERAQQERDKLAAELDRAAKQSADLDDKIDAIDAEKNRLIAEAKFPLPGLGFGDSVVTFGDLPLEQASSAEQLRVSMAMAMALNPTLRVIRVTDGSLLDSESLKIVEEMAKGNDFQVWLESVEESGKVGIVIADGQVAAINE